MLIRLCFFFFCVMGFSARLGYLDDSEKSIIAHYLKKCASDVCVEGGDIDATLGNVISCIIGDFFKTFESNSAFVDMTQYGYMVLGLAVRDQDSCTLESSALCVGDQCGRCFPLLWGAREDVDLGGIVSKSIARANDCANALLLALYYGSGNNKCVPHQVVITEQQYVRNVSKEGLKKAFTRGREGVCVDHAMRKIAKPLDQLFYGKRGEDEVGCSRNWLFMVGYSGNREHKRRELRHSKRSHARGADALEAEKIIKMFEQFFPVT